MTSLLKVKYLACADESIFLGACESEIVELTHLSQNLTPPTPTAKHFVCQRTELKV